MTELTADALVQLGRKPLRPEDGAAVSQADIEVSDRRDGARLASLRYLLDEKNRRGCVGAAPGVMDERAFVLKAVGATR